MQFPILTTKDLNGKNITLPDDFQHDLNLLFIGYLEWQQSEIDTWFPFATQLETEHKNLYFYELPVVGKMNKFGQIQLNYWMRQGIPNPETRGRTLTYYIDRAAFRQSLELKTEDHIGILLVDRAGHVLWKGYNGYSETNAQSLAAAVTKWQQENG
ncbi:MAG: hypothetical protein AB8G95_00775 [Anaerolineae bacterium]